MWVEVELNYKIALLLVFQYLQTFRGTSFQYACSWNCFNYICFLVNPGNEALLSNVFLDFLAFELFSNCKFHKHFMSKFFIRNNFVQLLWAYSLVLYFFGERNSAQNLLVKICWNWLLKSKWKCNCPPKFEQSLAGLMKWNQM